MDGLLIIDKPAGPTSHDVVQRVRRLLGQRRVGHGGTLDPAATGVLVVAAGQATRFFPYLPTRRKFYEGVIRLGWSTDTYDGSGRRTGEECRLIPGAEEVRAAMRTFEGEILQSPPPFSAKKLEGRPAYKLARARRDVRLKPVMVTVEAFRLLAYRPPHAEFEAVCSAGTYIRALAHDLGRTLGCGGHLATLRRTAVGPYSIRDAVPLDELEEAAKAGGAGRFLIPLEKLLPEAPAVAVAAGAERRVRTGAALGPAHLAEAASALPFPPPVPPGTSLVRLLDGSGKLLALAKLSPPGDELLPVLVLADRIS